MDKQIHPYLAPMGVSREAFGEFWRKMVLLYGRSFVQF